MLGALAADRAATADDCPPRVCRQTEVPGEFYFKFDGIRVASDDFLPLLFDKSRYLDELGVSVIDDSRRDGTILVRADPRAVERFLRSQPIYFNRDAAPSEQLERLLKGVLKDLSGVGKVYPNRFVYGPGGACNNAAAAVSVHRNHPCAPDNTETLRRPGEERVLVAVIDSGLGTGPFTGKLWRNLTEIPNSSADNDGNAIAGDFNGASFDVRPPTSDICYNTTHGTKVTGIIAGCCGAAKNVEIMTLRALDGQNCGTAWDVASAIDYAVENKAKIINISWATACDDPDLRRSVHNASREGVLLVAAAGNQLPVRINNNDTCPFYPASYRTDMMLSVNAVGPNGCELEDSRYGDTSVDASALGQNVKTIGVDGSYATLAGTSAAAPVVAGAAVLLAGHTPGWSWPARHKYLLASARPPRYDDLCRPRTATGRIISDASATAPPARFTKPPLDVGARSGRAIDIEWKNDFESESCTEIDFLLSTDGGLTFPVVLHEKVGIGDLALRRDLPSTGAVASAVLRLTCHGTTLSTDSPPFAIEP